MKPSIEVEVAHIAPTPARSCAKTTHFHIGLSFLALTPPVLGSRDMPPNVRRRSQPKKKKEDTTLHSSSAGPRRPRRKAEPLRYLIAGALVLGAIYTILTRRGQISSTSASEDRGPATKRDVGAEKPFQTTQGEVEGHGDFGDGRRTTAKPAFLDPASEALHWVNVNLGNGG